MRRNGKRVELRGDAAQLAWLARKAEQAGCSLVTARAAVGLPEVRRLAETAP